MAKSSLFLVALCGLVSLSGIFAEPAMYGGAPPVPPKYETPAPAKYEPPAKYGEKEEKYPEMDEAMKYKRSTDEETASANEDTIEPSDMTLDDFTPEEIEAARDAVLESLISMMDHSPAADEVLNNDTEELDQIVQDEDTETTEDDEETADPDVENSDEVERSAGAGLTTRSKNMGRMTSRWMKVIRLLIKKRIQARLSITGQCCQCRASTKRCIIRPIIVRKKIIRPIIVRRIVRPQIVRKILRPTVLRPRMVKKIIRPITVRKVMRPIYRKMMVCKKRSSFRRRCYRKRVCY